MKVRAGQKLPVLRGDVYEAEGLPHREKRHGGVEAKITRVALVPGRGLKPRASYNVDTAAQLATVEHDLADALLRVTEMTPLPRLKSRR